MSAVPVVFHGTMFPRDKSVKPYPYTSVGWAEIAGLEVGGGPIIPPDEIGEIPKPEPPLEIWGGPFDPPHPAHPIVLPDPILPPDRPPTTPPAKPHAGWNYYPPKNGWYFLYIPGEGQAQPKR